MRALVTIFLFLTWACTDVVAQNNPASFAGGDPGSLGSLENSVNLFTGQVGFPLTLAALPGRGGLNPELVATYSSAGVQQNVSTWNREAPTSMLGLGWNLDFSRIVCDHQNTGTRHDDTFYLVEGGMPSKLICTDADNDSNKRNYRVYRLENSQPWIVLYYYRDERWVITKENGFKYTFGDSNLAKTAGTIQYMVRWGNWIGNSIEQDGQKSQPYTWNLASVENLWGDKIEYQYANVEEHVGTATSVGIHTRASALSKVTGPTGNALVLTYGEKTCERCTAPWDFTSTANRREYQDPHVEADEPDAYQEKYETRYLADIKAYDERATLLYTVDLSYDFVMGGDGTSGEFYKRLLTRMQKTLANGAKIPASVFRYHKDVGREQGFLTQVDNSVGGVVTYHYKSKAAHDKVGKRDLVIKPPAGYKLPDVHVGSDYVVVVWRIPTRGDYEANGWLFIYQWEGEWVEYDMGDIGKYDGSDPLNSFQALYTFQPGFFALAKRSDYADGNCNFKDLFIFEKTTGGWTKTQENRIELPFITAPYDCHTGNWLPETFLVSGNRFIALGSRALKGFLTFTNKGDTWEKKRHEISWSANDVALTAGNNYIIYHNNDMNPGDKDLISMWFLTEDYQWVRRALPLDYRFASGHATKDTDGSDRSWWYTAPAFAVCAADDNPEFAYQWDEQYNVIKITELFETYVDGDPIMIGGNVVVGYAEKYVAAFNGASFVRYGVQTPHDPFRYHGPKNTAFTADGVVIGDRGTLSWGEQAQFELSTNAWKTIARGDSRGFGAANNIAVVDGLLRHRQPNGDWITLANYAVPLNEFIKEFNNAGSTMLTESILLNTSISSPDVAVRGLSPGTTVVHDVRNGKDNIFKIPYLMDSEVIFWEGGWKNRPFGGQNMLLAFPRSAPYKYNATSLYLYRFSDDQIERGHTVVVCQGVTVNDGYLNLNKSFDYDLGTAAVSATNSTPVFNQVDVVTGSLDPKIKPNGYTRYFFFNRKKFDNDPYNNFDKPVTLFTELLQGMPYRTEVYDHRNVKVHQTTTWYDRFEVPLTYERDHVTPIGTARFVRPTTTATKSFFAGQPEVTAWRSSAFDARNGTLTSTEETSGLGDGPTIPWSLTTYYYPGSDLWTSSDLPNVRNLAGEVIGTKTARSVDIQSTKTLWDFSGIPQPVATYEWRGFGSTDWVGSGDAVVPDSWRLVNRITKRDNKGNILESHDYRGNKSAAAFDDLARNPIVSASLCPHDQLAFTSFEAGQNKGCDFDQNSLDKSQAFTGTASLRANAPVSVALPPGRYEVHFWFNGTDASTTITGAQVEAVSKDIQRLGWTHYKARIILSGQQTISIKCDAALDELRVHTEGANVTTWVYNDREQKTAETNAAMLTTYFYYDAHDRQHYVTDSNKDIVKHYRYGYKKTTD